VEAEGSLQLVAWSPQVRRVCRLAGIDKAFEPDAAPA
jgi:anti-anti-sigma regulatory factor